MNRLPVRTINTFLIVAVVVLLVLLMVRLAGSIPITSAFTLIGVGVALAVGLLWLLVGRFIAAAVDALRWQVFALPILLIIAIGLIVALALQPTPAASSAPAAARSAVLLVTRFEPPPSGGSFPSVEEWRSGIAAQVAALPPTGFDIQVSAADVVVNSPQEALTLGDQHNAALVVWGDARLGGVDLRFTPTSRSCCDPAPISPAECLDQPVFSLNTGADTNYGYALLLGVLLHLNGARDAALVKLNEAARLADHERAGEINLAAALTYRGAALQAEGLLNEAIANYSSALTLDENLLCARSLRGSLYGAVQMWEPALVDHEMAVAGQTDWAYRGRALAYSGQEQYDAALNDLNAALRLGAADAANYYWRGMIYNARQDYASAVPDFDQAIRLAPGNAEYYAGRAAALREQGQIDAALRDLEEAARLSPTTANYHSAIGDLRFGAGNIEQAIADKNRAIALQPDNARYYTDLGGIYYFSYQDYPTAVEIYTQALYVDPRNVTAFYYRALSYYEMRIVDAALEDFDNAVQLDDQNATYRAWRARAYAEVGRAEEALLDLTEAIRLEPNVAAHYSALGDVYYSMGRYQEAIDSESQAIALDPSNARNYTDLGGIYLFALNDYDSAIATYSRALNINAQDSVALFYRGRAYFEAGRIDEARADMQAVFQLDPNNADYQAWLNENYQALGLSAPSF